MPFITILFTLSDCFYPAETTLLRNGVIWSRVKNMFPKASKIKITRTEKKKSLFLDYIRLRKLSLIDSKQISKSNGTTWYNQTLNASEHTLIIPDFGTDEDPLLKSGPPERRIGMARINYLCGGSCEQSVIMWWINICIGSCIVSFWWRF